MKAIATVLIMLVGQIATPAHAASQPSQPNKRTVGAYIWTGTPRRQFTQAEFQLLAKRYSVVIIAKYHGSSFADWDAAARRLTSLNPRIKVFANFLTTRVNKTFLKNWGSAFRDEWILRDQSGNKLSYGPARSPRGYLVDLTNSAYRSFLEDQVVQRLQSAPYAGLMFDNFHVPDPAATRADRGFLTLSGEKLSAYIEAETQLIQETKRRIGNRLFLYNGFSRGTKTARQSRNLNFLQQADGAQDEFYCYLPQERTFRPTTEMVEDIRLMSTLGAGHKVTLEAVKMRDRLDANTSAHVKRYCLAGYLLGYRPGYTFIQFKQFASQVPGSQIEMGYSVEEALSLGSPTSAFRQTGNILSRTFTRGMVYLNLDGVPRSITVQANYRLGNGGGRSRLLHQGQRYTIPAQDAVFFVK